MNETAQVIATYVGAILGFVTIFGYLWRVSRRIGNFWEFTSRAEPRLVRIEQKMDQHLRDHRTKGQRNG